MRYYEKDKWNHQALEDILTGEQLILLEDWLGVNGLEYQEYQDDMLNGVTVYGKHVNSDESWGIDFIRMKEVKNE